MRVWRDLLGGLALWTVHFFALYIIASVLPGARLAQLLILAFTVLTLGVDLWLVGKTVRALSSISDATFRWLTTLSLLSYILAAVAIVYQGLPAIFQ